MGDFDRNPTANGGKPAETKKMAMVVVLGLVLMGLVAMQLMKHGEGPQAAAGAPVADGVALPQPVVTDEISPDALTRMEADLQNDPTRTLLRGATHEDHSLDQVPTNPFNMNAAWQASLAHPAAAPGPVAPVRPVDLHPATPAAPATVLRSNEFRLSSIINGNMAIINGKIVKVKDTVGRARVLEIRDDVVVLQAADSPTGPTLEISTAPSLNSGN